ncbi:MAG: deoxyribodipyrimidine photo-lyase [Gemmatimonadaceae bacterium]|nr:deoxyribodipyrimidine photo-lyase [Gemmatimonadaceae bacterium]
MRDVDLVWFKRDLRIRDHAALTAACARGPVLCVYVYEPLLLHAPDHDALHLGFVNECLDDLERSLGERGVTLHRRTGDVPGVFAAVQRELAVLGTPSRIARIWAHEETTGWIAYQRDRAMRQYKAEGVGFEVPATRWSGGSRRATGGRRRWKHAWRSGAAAR